MRRLALALAFLGACADDTDRALDGAAPDADVHADARDAQSAPHDGSAGDAALDASTPGTRADATSDGASPDDDAGTSASRCASGAFAFCDDFESASIDMRAWEKIGAAESVTDKVKHGARALHVHATDNAQAGLIHRATLSSLGVEHWGRMWIHIAALPTSPPWAHWTVLGALPQGDTIYGLPEHRVGGQWNGSNNFWGVGTDHGATGDWTNLDTSAPTATGSWVCIEWHLDSARDVSELYRDGALVPALGTTTSTAHQGNGSEPYTLPDIRQLWIGWTLYQGGSSPGTYDVWIDSFALDDARVGCDP